MIIDIFKKGDSNGFINYFNQSSSNAIINVSELL